VPDYSEFPTTPTAWQEAQWEEIRPLQLEGPPAPVPERRRPDLVALIPGVIFTVLAIAFMAGVDLPGALFWHGGLVWVVLIGAGVLLLLSELRKTRRR
jgi:hypothetical protein